MEMVRALVEASSSVNQVMAPNGASPLLFASMIGDEDLVRYLLECRADTEAAMHADDATPLLCAATKGHASIVRVLVDAGANLEAAYRTGFRALFTAVIPTPATARRQECNRSVYGAI